MIISQIVFVVICSHVTLLRNLDILQNHLEFKASSSVVQPASVYSPAIWLMTLLLDLVQNAQTILLTALKQLLPCEVMEFQTAAV